MCKALGVSRSGYYAWRKKQHSCPEPDQEAELRRTIRRIHLESRGTYGRRRIQAALRREGHVLGMHRLRRLMREMGLQGRLRRRYRRTTDSNHSLPIAPNTLDRAFTQDAPNRVWVSDITYIRTGEGWLYLAVILDLFSRRIVGHSIQDHMQTELVLDALASALGRRQVAPGLLNHSDRGVQYASRSYRGRLRAHAMEASMSRKGSCLDNAVVESFFGTLKTELVHPAQFQTHEQARRAIYEYIEVFYNRRRLHSALDYMSPEEYEANYHRKVA